MYEGFDAFFCAALARKNKDPLVHPCFHVHTKYSASDVSCPAAQGGLAKNDFIANEISCSWNMYSDAKQDAEGEQKVRDIPT